MQQDFDPDFIIGVSVSGPDQKPQQGDIYSQLEDMIIQNNDYNVPSENGIKIQVPVLQFGVLDFDQAQTIYDIGYKTGLAMVDSIKKRVYAREPLSDVTARRERFAAATPEVVFDSVSVSGAATPGQAHYLEYLFEGPRHRPFTLENAKESYYRAVTDGWKWIPRSLGPLYIRGWHGLPAVCPSPHSAQGPCSVCLADVRRP